MKKVNALFVIPSLNLAGAEKQMVIMLNHLDRRIFNTHLFIFEKEADLLSELSTDVKFYQCPKNSRFDLKMIRTLAKIIDTENIDLMYCSLLYASFIGWFARKLAKGSPVFFSALHSTFIRGNKSWLQQKLIYNRILKNNSKIITCADNQKKWWVERQKIPASKVEVVYNGIKPPVAGQVRNGYLKNELGIGEEIIIGVIAGFRPEKGHEYFLRAVRLVKNNNIIPFKVLLVGDGAERRKIVNLAKSLYLDEDIIFLGFRKDIYELLSIMDIVVLPSVAETFPMSILEAMSQSKAVVVTRVGGLEEMVAHRESGYIVEPRNAGQMAGAILDLLSDECKRTSYGKKGKEIFDARFSAETMADKISELILSCV